jgi:hypothetical protein
VGLVRRGDRSCFYESFREDGRVTSRYLCSGELAEDHAHRKLALRRQLARYRRRARRRRAELEQMKAELDSKLEELRRLWLRQRALLEEIESLVSGSDRQSTALFRCAMMAAGFRRHKRGEWRRRRAMASQGSGRPEGGGPGGADGEVTADDLLQRADAGDESVAPTLRRRFTEERGAFFPFLVGPRVGLLQGEAEGALVSRVSHGDPVRRVAVGMELERLRRKLMRDGITPLEQVLVDQVVVCWLDARAAELDALLPWVMGPRAREAYHERRKGRAQRRPLAAVRALELYRGKAAPRLDELVL